VSKPTQTPLFRWLVRHWVAAFVLMGAGFFAFGAVSLNLAHLFMANIGFLVEHGLDAVREGGLLQFAQLLASAYVAVAFFLLFKICEQALVVRLSAGQPKEET